MEKCAHVNLDACLQDVLMCAELSRSKAIWKHGRSFLHLFAPTAFSAAYVAAGRNEKGEESGEEV